MRTNHRINIATWTVQLLLATLFLFAGGAKLVMPIAAMTKQMPLPGFFLRFLGIIEFAGSAPSHVSRAGTSRRDPASALQGSAL